MTESSQDENISPSKSAESFPKSHQISYTDFSRTSSIMSEMDPQRSPTPFDMEDAPKGTPKISLEEVAEKLTSAAHHIPVSSTEVAQAAEAKAIAKSEEGLPNNPIPSTSELSTLAHQGSTTSVPSVGKTSHGAGSVKESVQGESDNEEAPVKTAFKTVEYEQSVAVPSAGGNQSQKEAVEYEQSVAIPSSESNQSQEEELSEESGPTKANQTPGAEAEGQAESEPSTPKKNGGAGDESKENVSPESIAVKTKEGIVSTDTGAETLDSLAADTPSPRLNKKGGSASSLSPGSEPFVPSSSLSNGTATGKGDGFLTPTRSLNANAAAFVPSGPPSYEATPSDASHTDHLAWPHAGPQNDSLAASPHPQSAHDLPEWTAEKYASYDQGTGGEWQYGYDHMWTDPNGYTWIMQADGSWVLYDDLIQHSMGGWNYNGEYDYDQGVAGDVADRGSSKARSGKRPKDRQWNAALADILAKHYQRSPALIGSILDLHEGSMTGILDMLGQLEAEKNGQLLSNPQEAPELNEENFPSLASPARPEAGASKAGFANAVKAARPSSPQEKTSTPSAQAQTRSWDDEAVSSSDGKAAAQARVAHEKHLRDDAFTRAVWAALAKDVTSLDAWAIEGKKHSDLLVGACMEADQVLYKHRSVAPKRRKGGRLSGPVDLTGFSEKEAIDALESEIATHSGKRQRSPSKFVSEQPICLLLGAPKGSKAAHSTAQQIESWLKASQVKYSVVESGFIELYI